MALSSDLISQFVKITKDSSKTKKETTVYGTTVEYNGSIYVKLDGSDLLTPILTTADMKAGERVTVMIKNHTATVTGNISSPSARKADVNNIRDTLDTIDAEGIKNKISEFEILIADKVSTEEFDAEQARIDELRSDNVVIKKQLSANEASISELKAENVSIEEKLTANEASISNLETTKLDVLIADAKYATIADLDATNANLYNLESTYGDFVVLTTSKFDTIDASISDLETNKLSAKDAEIKYANIDFSNIGKAAIEYFYATSGLIEDVVVGDGTITGRLVGVTITGDLIEGNTVVAEKLVIKGEDGLYYKLNTDGMTTETEQTEYNSINGNIILANSITATKINVDDLVAFDATIGGFNITNNALYSGVKDSIDNDTQGIYLDSKGQMSIGDSSNFIKYYKHTDGTYKLDISASSILFKSGTTNLETEMEDVKANTVTNTKVLYALSDSRTIAPTKDWSVIAPEWVNGKYMWQKTVTTFGNGDNKESEPTCISGASGADGEDATVLRIDSSRGTVFKNNHVNTILSVVIYHGSQ